MRLPERIYRIRVRRGRIWSTDNVFSKANAEERYEYTVSATWDPPDEAELWVGYITWERVDGFVREGDA